jgi:hypothetical protein
MQNSYCDHRNFDSVKPALKLVKEKGIGFATPLTKWGKHNGKTIASSQWEYLSL